MKQKLSDYLEAVSPGNIFPDVEFPGTYGGRKWDDEVTERDLKNVIAVLNKSGDIRAMSKNINHAIKLAIDLGYTQGATDATDAAHDTRNRK